MRLAYLITIICLNAFGAKEVIELETPFDPVLLPYVFLLRHPGPFLMALEEVGQGLRYASRIEIPEKGAARLVGNFGVPFEVELYFVGEEVPRIFLYKLKVREPGAGSYDPQIQLAVDTSMLTQGFLKLRIGFHGLLGNFLYRMLKKELKEFPPRPIPSNVQYDLIQYFKRLESHLPSGDREANLVAAIIDTYHRKMAPAVPTKIETEDWAFPLSHQVLLGISLFLWIVLVPLVVVGQYILIGRRHKYL